MTTDIKTPLIPIELKDKVYNLFFKLEYLNKTGNFNDRIAKHIANDMKCNGSLNNKIHLLIPNYGSLALSLTSLLLNTGIKISSIINYRTPSHIVNLLNLMKVDLITCNNETEVSTVMNKVRLECKENKEELITVDKTTFEFGLKNGIKELINEILIQCPKLTHLVLSEDFYDIKKTLVNYLEEIKVNFKVIVVNTNIILDDDLDIKNSKKIQIVKTEDKKAHFYFKKLIQEYGILAGPTSGAVLSAILNSNIETNSNVIGILNDSYKDYLEILLNEEDIVEDTTIINPSYGTYNEACVEDLQLPAAVTIPKTTDLETALNIMEERDYSQLPIVNEHRKLIGYITKQQIMNSNNKKEDKVLGPMYHFNKNQQYIIITPDTLLKELNDFFEHHEVAFVTDRNRKFCLGVVTKNDLTNFYKKKNQFYI
ncbi:CBS-domain-containing protein [Neoconidiobolus thromboides FSU 785]|nr:CBS-domain-containing protein [Neoconidiobolus thromboides FSU 785]